MYGGGRGCNSRLIHLMNLFNAIQTLALRDVLKPDGEYQLRRIMRWYSKTFATPLHLVAELPLEDVLRAYYEEEFERMEEDERERQRVALSQSEEERREAQSKQEKEEEELDEFVQQVEADEARRAAKLTANDAPQVPIAEIQAPKHALAESQIQGKPITDMPDIKMTFSNLPPEEFENEIGEWGTMAQPEKKR